MLQRKVQASKQTLKNIATSVLFQALNRLIALFQTCRNRNYPIGSRREEFTEEAQIWLRDYSLVLDLYYEGSVFFSSSSKFLISESVTLVLKRACLERRVGRPISPLRSYTGKYRTGKGIGSQIIFWDRVKVLKFLGNV